MNWSYAKSIIIVLLIILNLILCGIRINDSNNRYLLDEEAESNIRNILVSYNYHLYTVLPKEYYPLREIKASKRNIDNLTVANHFLKDENKINKRNDGNKEIYYIDDKEYVEIYRNGKINYYQKIDQNHEALIDNNITKTEAYNILTKFMGRVYKGDRIYKAVGYSKENGVYKYTYYNTYQGTNIFNDYIQIEIHNDHIKAEIWGVNVSSSNLPKKEIIPVDEIIFNFVKNVPSIEEGTYITDIKLGYYAINEELMVNSEVFEKPYYKISIRYHGDYYVDAYSNVIYDNNLIRIK